MDTVFIEPGQLLPFGEGTGLDKDPSFSVSDSVIDISPPAPVKLTGE